MKFLVDMNLSPKWVDSLSAAGWEAVHWSRVGRGNAPDREIMRWAAKNEWTLLTSDLDFGAILAATGGRRPSVVQVRGENLAPPEIGGAVLSAIRQMKAEIEAGAIISVDVARTRVRVLPLGE